MTTDITELAQREKFEAWVITQICISKSTLEGLRTSDGYRNSTLSGRDYNLMWNLWKAAGAELVEALEKAQGMEAYWKTQCRGITDHCEELQARIAELESHTVKPPVHPTVASENLDDETLQELIEFRRTTFEYHSKEGNKVQTIIHGVTLAALRELQERRKADSEPVAEVVSIYGDPEAFGEREIRPLVGIQQMPYGTKLYSHAQPAAEREQVRSAHAEWSQATFGNVGPVGPLKHLSKEALEAAEQPGDLSEWADMQFLLWDAQRRAGITDEQITQAMIEKLAVNKQRKWPEPKDGEPRMHIKEQPAPEAMPECFRNAVSALESLYRNGQKQCWHERYTTDMAYASGVLNACRAAMLQAEPVCTCPSGDGSLRWPCPVHPGNSPAIPDAARDALEKALTAMEFMGDTLNNLDAVCSEDVEFVTPAFDAVRRVLAAAPQEVKGE